MQIDWFTLIAQIVNFLILVVLLKYLLYKPITKAMDEREESIASRLKEAEEKIEGAQQEAESYHKKQKELEEQRDAMLAQAKEEAGAYRNELIHEARKDVDEVKAKWYESVEREKDGFLKELRRRASAQVYAAIRNALAALANEDLEQRITDVFIERIEKLDESQRKRVVASMQDSDRKAVVTSTFPIAEKKRQRVTKALQAQLVDDMDIHFETSSDLMCGLELKAGGCKVAWSLEDYLEDLEERLSEVLGEEIETAEEEDEEGEKEDEEAS